MAEATTKTETGMHFQVDQIFDGPRLVKAMAVRISENEITLMGPMDQTLEEKFVWLEFGLGNDARRIKALGEIVHQGPATRTVRFKHIFPDHKQLLLDYLDRSTAN